MMSLPGVVVNPFSSGLRVQIHAFEGSTLWGKSVDGKSAYKIDLSQGVVYHAEKFEHCLCRGVCPEGYQVLDPMYPRLKAAWQRVESLKFFVVLPRCDERAYGLISALATGRVSAPDMEKGLKARGFKFSGKILNNYLGGWNFTNSEGYQITPECFVRECLAQRS